MRMSQAVVCLFLFLLTSAQPLFPASILLPGAQDDGQAAAAAAEQRRRIGEAFDRKAADDAAQAQIQAALAVEPWRVVNGVTNSVYDDGWCHISGKVLGVSSLGILVNGYFSTLPDHDLNRTTFLLVNFPHVVADKDILEFSRYYMAKPVGTQKLVSMTVRKFDYGKVCGPSPEYLAARAAKASERKRAADMAVLNLDKEKAADGNPLYQYRLGLRYLNGNGVDKNPEKAAELLRKSADQGNKDAAAELAKLNDTPPQTATNAPSTKTP